jgi:hypothetical protein
MGAVPRSGRRLLVDASAPYAVPEHGSRLQRSVRYRDDRGLTYWQPERQDVTVGEFVAGVGDRLVSWNRAVAPLWFWMGIVWGWLALATSVRELFLTHWFVAAVQIVVAGVLLLGLPFGRAYVRRRRYHAGLLARADEAMGKGA